LSTDAISGSIANDDLNFIRLKHFAMRHDLITPSNIHHIYHILRWRVNINLKIPEILHAKK
jgi:hypothetical protein